MSKQEPETTSAEITAEAAAHANTGAKPAETPALSPEEIAALKTKAAKADENWDRLLRVTADLENYKKRAAREKIEAVHYANHSLIQKLLPILDNFEMALNAAQDAQASRPDGAATEGDKLAGFQAGVVMIQQQLKTALTETGLEEIDATGKLFDPNFHEAISQQESHDTPEDHVLQQLRKGYKLKDRLLRPATVIVAKKPAEKPAANPPENPQ